MSWLQPFRDAAAGHEAVVGAYTAAGEKRYRKAVATADKVRSAWSDPETAVARFARWWHLRHDLRLLADDLASWKDLIGKADKLAAKARRRLQAAGDDPEALDTVEESIKAWSAALAILAEPTWQTEQQKATEAKTRRLAYRDLYQDGVRASEALWFQRACQFLAKARELFPASRAAARLADAQGRLAEEAAFETTMGDSAVLAQKQLYRSALKRLQSAVSAFPREDGRQQVLVLERKAKAQALYDLGLTAEWGGEWTKAAKAYSAAEDLDPTIGNPARRQAAVAAAAGVWETVRRSTEGSTDESMLYLQGYAQARQGYYRDAARTWQKLPPAMAGERAALKELVIWQRSQAIRAIAAAVEGGDMVAADAICQRFIKAFGPDAWVERTWQWHVQPRRLRDLWASGDWAGLSRTLAGQWQQSRTLSTLHNWAVAAYFAAEGNPQALATLVAVWPSALANAGSDPALGDVPWLTGKTPDHAALQADGMRVLDERIMATRDTDPDGYRRLQSQLAPDRQALRLMKEGNGVRPGMDGMVLLPGLVRLTPGLAGSLSGLSTTVANPDRDLLSTLYTDWGIAVALCLEGHAAEADIWLPLRKAEAPVERLAVTYVTCQRALAHLQLQHWQEGFATLKMGAERLVAQPDWWHQLDQACTTLAEQLPDSQQADFAKAWHQTLGTPAAARHHVSQEVRRIRERLAQETLTFANARTELETLQRLDAKHPMLLEVLGLVRKIQEEKRIVAIVQSQGMEAAVRQIRHGGTREAKDVMADFCARIAVQGLENRTLPPQEVLTLVRWAHEMAPRAPEWQELYRACRL